MEKEKCMDSMYPYRIAWQKPVEVNVGSSSRAAVLDAMEYDSPTSRSRLCGRTGLGAATVRRACRQLIREGVMTLQYGRDPDSGAACDLVALARYPVLPVVEITDAYMVYRLCDTRGQSVFSTVRDRGGFCTPEDDLLALMGQASAILRAGTCGLPASIPLQPPVLLINSEDSALCRSAKRILPTPPAFVLTPKEAAAHELRYHAATRNASSILHIRTGESESIALFTRAPSDTPGALYPLPCMEGLGQTIRQRTRGIPPHTRAWWLRAAEVLSDFLGYVIPDCIVAEIDRPTVEPEFIRAHLPSHIPLVFLQYALNTPSLAHRGALRLTRRALWDSLERPLDSSTN